MNFSFNKVNHFVRVEFYLASFLSDEGHKIITYQLKNNLCKFIDFLTFKMSLFFDKVINFIDFAGIFNCVVRIFLILQCGRSESDILLFGSRRRVMILILMTFYEAVNF